MGPKKKESHFIKYQREEMRVATALNAYIMALECICIHNKKQQTRSCREWLFYLTFFFLNDEIYQVCISVMHFWMVSVID